MNKFLITIMVLWFRIGVAQNCISDVPRISNYAYMEVLNSTTGHFEKYNKTNNTDLHVLIDTKIKSIHFVDPVNDYDKIFTITGCLMSDTTLTYECIDNDNKKNCQLIFSANDYTYDLVVRYETAPIVYRVSRNKNTN